MEGCKQIEVHANGLKFVAYEGGQGPLVLCLHGFPDHARSFRHQVGPLIEAGYRVVAPFMRGYAPTERPADGNYQSAALARDTLGLIDALGEERAVIFGHDWGALTAYGAAILAPERITKLVTGSVPYGPAFMTAFIGNYEQLKRSWYVYFFQAVPTGGGALTWAPPGRIQSHVEEPPYSAHALSLPTDTKAWSPDAPPSQASGAPSGWAPPPVGTAVSVSGTIGMMNEVEKVESAMPAAGQTPFDPKFGRTNFGRGAGQTAPRLGC